MTKNYIRCFIAAAFLCGALQTYAADPSPSPAASTSTESDDWAALQKEAASLKTRADIAKYRADIAKYEADARNAGMQGTPALTSPLPGGPLPAGPLSLQGAPMVGSGSSATVSTTAGNRGRPSLVRIGAADGQYGARIEMNGNSVDVRAGDTLEGGWSVVSIDASGVKLRHGKQPLLVLR
jgi:type IV pilus biogenesis protein PilP